MTTPTSGGGPAIPARVRTVAYFIGLAIGAATILATGVAAAVWPASAGTVLAVCGAVSGAATFILGALGVAFRPTAGLPSAAELWGDGTPVATTPVIGDPPASTAFDAPTTVIPVVLPFIGDLPVSTGA